MLVFLYNANSTAIAPHKEQIITDYEPVIVTPVVVDPYWGVPSVTMGPNPQKRLEEGPIIENLTPKTAVGHTPSVQEAKNYALAQLGAVQYSCIDQIFIHESHWNPYDLNPTSGAYGIPQAVPGSKMSWAGSDWRTNPITQVKWGIHYVNVRYGSACAAWDFWKINRWY